MTKRKNIPTKTIIHTVLKQGNKCANRPGSNIRNIGNFECPRWKFYNGEFDDQSGFEIDHILEHALGGRENETNVEALCLDCHRVKTKNFRAKLAERNEKKLDAEDDELAKINRDAKCEKLLNDIHIANGNPEELENLLMNESVHASITEEKLKHMIKIYSLHKAKIDALTKQIKTSEKKLRKTEIEFKKYRSQAEKAERIIENEPGENVIELSRNIYNKLVIRSHTADEKLNELNDVDGNGWKNAQMKDELIEEDELEINKLKIKK